MAPLFYYQVYVFKNIFIQHVYALYNLHIHNYIICDVFCGSQVKRVRVAFPPPSWDVRGGGNYID